MCVPEEVGRQHRDKQRGCGAGRRVEWGGGSVFLSLYRAHQKEIFLQGSAGARIGCAYSKFLEEWVCVCV